MSSHSPTMMDVARVAGVGVATVDRVLNRRAAVRKNTEEKVLNAAFELGFALEKFKIFEELTEAAAPSRPRVPAKRLAFVLLRQVSTFYQELEKVIRTQAARSEHIAGEPEVLTLEHESPHEIAALLLELGSRNDAIALVTLDHPAINQAIDTLSRQGVSVFSLVTDVTAARRAGYIGIDNRKAGRTAAWAISRMSHTPGKVGILIGDHRFLCQELCEISFRSWFRERGAGFTVLETELTLERPDRAYEVTRTLLAAHADLRGLYVSGGGIEGVVQALQESGRQREVVVICTDLTETTRAALIDEVADVVLSHPRERLIEALIEAVSGHQEGAGTHVRLLPFDVVTTENL